MMTKRNFGYGGRELRVAVVAAAEKKNRGPVHARRRRSTRTRVAVVSGIRRSAGRFRRRDAPGRRERDRAKDFSPDGRDGNVKRRVEFVRDSNNSFNSNILRVRRTRC